MQRFVIGHRRGMCTYLVSRQTWQILWKSPPFLKKRLWRTSRLHWKKIVRRKKIGVNCGSSGSSLGLEHNNLTFKTIKQQRKHWRARRKYTLSTPYSWRKQINKRASCFRCRAAVLAADKDNQSAGRIIHVSKNLQQSFLLNDKLGKGVVGRVTSLFSLHSINVV